MTLFNTSACKRSAIALAVTLSQTFLLAPFAVQADNSVRIAGQVVFTNKAASGGLSADQRAETIQRNLDNALVAAKDRSPSSVNIVYVKGLPVITVGGYQVATVDAANAKAANTTPALLAQRWADALRGSLQDTGSVDSYVAQLSGTYSSSAPPASVASNAPVNPPSSNASNQPYNGGGDQYDRNTGNNGNNGNNGPQYQGQAQYNNQPPYNGQASGYGGPPNGGYNGQANGYNGQANGYGGGQPMQRGRVVYAPAGLVIPVSLRTSISTQAAQSGDLIEAALDQPINLGESSIPSGSVLIGQITEAKAGGFLGRSGMLGIKFNRLRTPDGVETPMSAHIQGGVGKYADGNNNDTFHGETWKNKVGQAALRGAIGAGTGAALGTAVGAIAGRGGRGAGRGAWSGTAIGGGLGVVDSLVLRKGKEVTIHSGTQMQVQLDAPMSVSGGGVPPYAGTF